ncbi:hypothetical protein Tco_0568799 [Tanacetum coccineum]
MANLEFCDKHNMVAYLKKPTGSEGFQEIVDFLNGSHIRYALTKNPTIYVSLIEKFWQTATVRTVDNGEQEITATVDGKEFTITEASVRRHLQLADVDGLVVQGDKDINYLVEYITHHRPLVSPPHTNVADEAASTGVDVRHGGAAITVTSLDAGQGSGNIDKTPTMPHNSSLLRVNTLGSDEGRMQQNELMDLVTKLSDRVVALETDLQQTKKVYGAAFIKLIKKVKRLEKKDKLSKSRRKARIIVSDDEEDLEDPSKQGKKIDEIDQDPNISLVQHDTEFNFDFNAAKEVSTAEENVSTAEPVSTAGAAVTTTSVAISTATPTRVSTIDDIASESLVYIRRSAAKTKDKGKSIMEESESTMTKTKRQQEQERLGLETAVRLQEEFDEEKRQRIAKRLQAEEKEKYTEAEQERLLIELINQRKRYFAKQRAEERRNKPPTQAQQRTYMSNYIKNMGNYTLKHEDDRAIPKLAAESSKRLAEEELDQQSSKKQKTGESSEPRDKEVDELSQEELHQMMIITLGSTGRSSVGNHTEVYQFFDDMLKAFDIDDLVMLWNTEDELWKLQKHIHDLTWKLYDSCEVHHVSTKDGLDIYMLVEREYPLSKGVLTHMLISKLLVEQDNEMSRELLRKIFMQAERPRR